MPGGASVEVRALPLLESRQNSELSFLFSSQCNMKETALYNRRIGIRVRPCLRLAPTAAPGLAEHKLE